MASNNRTCKDSSTCKGSTITSVLAIVCCLAAVVLMGFSTSYAASQSSQSSTEAAWQALKSGKAVLIMRHALAPGVGDPAEFSIDDCGTQRNLSEQGRQQAIAIGQKIISHGIDSASVLSSEWCRCVDTARLLGVGEVQTVPTLNSFFRDWSTQESQTQALLNSMRTWLEDPSDVKILVSHQVNISALTNRYAQSGDMLILTLQNDQVVVLAQIGTQ